MTDAMASLAAEAHLFKPRIFSIYGRYNGEESADFIGWGMAFPDVNKTVYYEPGSAETHRADTPERILESFQVLAEAHLEWLEEE